MLGSGMENGTLAEGWEQKQSDAGSWMLVGQKRTVNPKMDVQATEG
jgi:hypothetical protein